MGIHNRRLPVPNELPVVRSCLDQPVKKNHPKQNRIPPSAPPPPWMILHPKKLLTKQTDPKQLEEWISIFSPLGTRQNLTRHRKFESMATNSEAENSQRGNTGAATRVKAKPDSFLIVCRCFSFVTSLAALLCIAVNVLSAVRSFKNGSNVI